MRNVQRRSGFTLVELAVVTGVVATVAALSYSAYGGLRERAAARNGIREIVSVLKRARGEAFARGAPVVFWLRPDASGTLEYGVVVDYDSDFDPTSIEGSLEPTDFLVVRGTSSSGVSFRGVGEAASLPSLPAPFTSLPADAPCTFCETPRHVVVVFRTNGTAALGDAPGKHLVGGSFALVADDPRRPTAERRVVDHQTVAIVSRTGAVVAFDR